VNGWFVGHHESGYSGFRYDITDVLNYGGKNTIAVRVDASQFEGWFYEGAGIYRHVWLIKTAPVAIAPDGVFVSSLFPDNTPGDKVDVHVETDLRNDQTNDANVTVTQEVFSPDGGSVGKFQSQTGVVAQAQAQHIGDINVDNPILWSPESPKLYKLVTTVEADGQVVDQQQTEFGIRTVGFDADKGFLLNGKPYALYGTCNHQDAAGVGSALPDRLQYFRVAKLKEWGVNAYRTSHNPPTAELIEACDHLGMLVMDECRLLGSDAENLNRWEWQIRRDRSHPSVAIWSICNEEPKQSTPDGGRVGATMQRLIKKLDTTRPVTAAENTGDDHNGIMPVLDVRGWNYHIGQGMDDYHSKYPQQPHVGTEQGSTVSTRGIYTNDVSRGYVSAYDDNGEPWSNTAEEWWSYFADRPWLSGGFIWTGFDYRGEPTPYGWPCINSHFGILDTCGFPKDLMYYYKAWWTKEPVLHLLPHWNWPGREGQDIDVRAESNCEEVELFLNGQSLGRKSMKRNSELKWTVKYTAGTLSAKGYSGGNVVAETKVETTGEPTTVTLTPDRSSIAANGEDLSIFTVTVTDAQGRVVPLATNLVHFNLEGAGKILGVGNGDPSCHEPDTYIAQQPVRSVSLNDDWFSKPVNYGGDKSVATAQMENGDTAWQKANVTTQNGDLQSHHSAVYLRKLTLTDADLASPAIVLLIGGIDDNGWVYINGQTVGESHDWQSAPSFDVKQFLHAGENTITIGVENVESSGGLNKGVSLQLATAPVAADWQRSVFNGLAQVIVQSSKDPGDLKLTATAEGLTSATSTVTSQAAVPRPSVP
jgi:beta-galactosidase